MSYDGSLELLRNGILDSIKGRKLGLNPAGYLQGQLAVRDAATGLTGQTTVLSTASAALPNYGVSLVGSTISSGSSASSTSAYALADPVPGVRKMLFNPSTGNLAVITSSAATFCSSGSVTSTYWQVTLNGKGSFCELIGLTTGLWGVLSCNQISTGGIGVTFG